MQHITTTYNGYIITTDKALMKPDDVYKWLSEESYWCKGIPHHLFKGSYDHSFCIGALAGEQQVAYGRLITDYTTFGYLADVYVHPDHRGKGISKQMMSLLFNLDWVKGLRRIMLATRDAHDLYRQVGFTECIAPDRLMELVRPHIYEQQQS